MFLSRKLELLWLIYELTPEQVEVYNGFKVHAIKVKQSFTASDQEFPKLEQGKNEKTKTVDVTKQRYCGRYGDYLSFVLDVFHSVYEDECDEDETNQDFQMQPVEVGLLLPTCVAFQSKREAGFNGKANNKSEVEKDCL